MIAGTGVVSGKEIETGLREGEKTVQLVVLLPFRTRVNDFIVKWLSGDAISKASKPHNSTTILAKMPQPSHQNATT